MCYCATQIKKISETLSIPPCHKKLINMMYVKYLSVIFLYEYKLGCNATPNEKVIDMEHRNESCNQQIMQQ